MMKLYRYLILLFFISTSFLSMAAEDIVFNKPISSLDTRYSYTYELMKLVIDATPGYGKATINTSTDTMTRSRLYVELVKGDLVNVMAEAPQKAWDEKLIAVLIPIRKGIQGFRTFIIKNENREKIAEVDSLQKFILLKTGSGSRWSTRLAMEKAGFKVETSNRYESLF